jgi:hypothetical protein
VRHAVFDVADAAPGVQPEPQRPERAVIRGARKPGEAECCQKESATLVEHALLDDLVCPQQHRLRNGESERLGGLEVDH